jgi:DNA-binding protein H-NS
LESRNISRERRGAKGPRRLKTMALKAALNQNLTDQQRLERLAQLCEELQAAVDEAGDHRRLLEKVEQTAQELLSDQESEPQRKKTRKRD